MSAESRFPGFAIAYLQFAPPDSDNWKIGMGDNPQGNATADYKRRTTALTKKERANAEVAINYLFDCTQ